ncbi:hypothetical protein E3P99_01064 [Wallemia hederae]|uniref:AAA+ ATPase domain-containing protein n=1 Tax=Wallemia hederae TaxID=1540922 RepID=A0A4T0FTP1_9BASI|nr:hypothetical protein E3P99_01064 [Wallemia hederae]
MIRLSMIRTLARSAYGYGSSRAVVYSRPITRSCVREQSTLSAEQTDDGYAGKDEEKMVPDTAHSPIEKYKQLIQTGVLNPDGHQLRIINKLNELNEELVTYEPRSLVELDKRISVSSEQLPWWKKIVGGRSQALIDAERDQALKDKRSKIPKGLYLYGDVGTGKSMLMDLFHSTVPLKFQSVAQRWHFHAFMQGVHKRIHQARSRGSQDALDDVIKEIAHECTILSFDEFQVVDIVDAMILRRLLDGLIDKGVVCVMTSNRHPDQLYLNGIQRESFLPCIDLLKTSFEVVDLNSGTDYRKLPRALNKVYFSPNDAENRAEFDKIWNAVTADVDVSQRQLEVWGRKLSVPMCGADNARFTFAELCGKPLSAADYLEIVHNFNTIFIDDIPRLSLNVKDQARRLITFIDAAYESKTRLFLLSETPIENIFADESQNAGEITDVMRSAMDDLGLDANTVGASSMFTGQEEVFAFARAVSRLSEMSSRQYAELSAGGK